MARRTVLKLTRWSAAEWRRVEEAARPYGIPPLRFVREAVLERTAQDATQPRPQGRRAADELVHQLGRVLNNLQQLQRVAEDDWADEAAARIGELIAVTTAATRNAPGRARKANTVLRALVPAGKELNDLARRANASQAFPPSADVLGVLVQIEAAVRRCLA